MGLWLLVLEYLGVFLGLWLDCGCMYLQTSELLIPM
jgi:hypothetical protein